MLHKTLSFSNLVHFEFLFDTEPYFILHLDLILFDKVELNLNIEYEVYTYMKNFKNIKQVLESIFSIKLTKINGAFILGIYILRFIHFYILLDTNSNEKV